MTKEEIRKFLDNTKVYVNGKSKEIQEKLFSFGYCWCNPCYKTISYTNNPFLFIASSKTLTYGSDMEHFIIDKSKEITAEEILALEITEPSYRPFKDKDECWNEMLKHQPFGWLIGKVSGLPTFIPFLLYNSLFIHNTKLTYEEAMGQYTFADGIPFGIKED